MDLKQVLHVQHYRRCCTCGRLPRTEQITSMILSSIQNKSSSVSPQPQFVLNTFLILAIFQPNVLIKRVLIKKNENMSALQVKVRS